MSGVNFLDKLLDGAGAVETPLGEVAEIKRGTSITQKDVTPGEIPVIAGGGARLHIFTMSVTALGKQSS
jgi:type I restriction enzyme S subunit